MLGEIENLNKPPSASDNGKFSSEFAPFPEGKILELVIVAFITFYSSKVRKPRNSFFLQIYFKLVLFYIVCNQRSENG
jgi:hypothetical protein